MRILITNDDGIHDPGLSALESAARKFGETEAVAPRDSQSAKAHSITLNDPLLVQSVRLEGNPACKSLSINGTPADCVKFAIKNHLQKEPDMVLSGINGGANIGVNVLYSGTVAAAAEAAMMGIPAIAFSADNLETERSAPDFEEAAYWVGEVLEIAIKNMPWPGYLLNVNIPTRKNRKPEGIKVCPQSDATLDDLYIAHQSDNGDTLYYLANNYNFNNPHVESDIVYLDQGYITITPLKLDLTNYKLIGKIKEIFETSPDQKVDQQL